MTRTNENFKIIFEDRWPGSEESHWTWRVISPWNFTSAGHRPTLRSAQRAARRAMRRLSNIRSATVDSGNPPTYETPTPDMTEIPE